MKVAIVVDHPEVAHSREIERNVKANLDNLPEAQRTESNRRLVEQRVRKMVGDVKPQGTVHAIVDLECPSGMPNCRNCGDPDYADSCSEAGHCPDCGIKHGCAPASIVVANGYRLVAQ